MCIGICTSGWKDRGKRQGKVMRALHCPTRWLIMDCFGEDAKSTKEIQDCLQENEEEMTASCLYYHLSELKKAGIIEVAGYKEEGGGAPEKIWRLKSRQIVIDLLEIGTGNGSDRS